MLLVAAAAAAPVDTAAAAAAAAAEADVRALEDESTLASPRLEPVADDPSSPDPARDSLVKRIDDRSPLFIVRALLLLLLLL